MSGRAGASAPPISDATERCGNFASCGALVSRSAAGAGGCGGCRVPVYCGDACQRAHWPAHKAQCQENQRATAKVASAVPTLVGALPPIGPTLAAALAGDAVAQLDVGLAYATGTGVAHSWPSAFEWNSWCAAQPAPPRSVWAALGDFYHFGRGVAADAVEAVRLYRVGTSAGDAGAQYALAYCLTFAVGVPAPDVHSEFALYSAAAAQDHAPAIMNLGVCYAEGTGVTRDERQAVALLQRVLAHPRACPATVTNAAFNLGATYWKGADGVPRDTELAIRYWRQAAAGGHETAARLLAARGLA